jgi:hypothetical protein
LIGRLLRAGITYAILAVAPALASNSAVPANTVHWQGGGVVTWEAKLHRPIAPQTIHRLDFALAPGASKVIAHWWYATGSATADRFGTASSRRP